MPNPDLPSLESYRKQLSADAGLIEPDKEVFEGYINEYRSKALQKKSELLKQVANPNLLKKAEQLMDIAIRLNIDELNYNYFRAVRALERARGNAARRAAGLAGASDGSPELAGGMNNLDLPERMPNAMTGSDFFRNILGVDPHAKPPRMTSVLSPKEIEAVVMRQIEMGNVPNFLRQFREVRIAGPNGITVVTKVMPDYLSIGSDGDFMYIPVTASVAAKLAEKLNLVLPTRTMVEETFAQANRKNVGIHWNVPNVADEGYLMRHNEESAANIDRNGLNAGHKKDIIISEYSSAHPGVLDFYGLYDEKQNPIQTSPAHYPGWREYDLGVRFASPAIQVIFPDGRTEYLDLRSSLHTRPDVGAVINRVERVGSTPDAPKPRNNRFAGNFDPGKNYRRKS